MWWLRIKGGIGAGINAGWGGKGPEDVPSATRGCTKDRARCMLAACDGKNWQTFSTDPSMNAG